MIYVGIDIAKNIHYAAVSNSNGEVLVDPFPFGNNIEGFTILLNSISSFSKDDLIIGLEATAHYGESLIQFLFNLDFKITLLNPLQTASMRKSKIRLTKTDKIDTLIIIKVLSLGEFKLITHRDISLIMLKSLCRSRRNLITLRTRSKIQLVSYVDQLFPELASFFKDNLHINTSYKLLSVHPNPKEITKLHLTYLANLLSKASRGKYNKSHARSLKDLASKSIGIENPILSSQIHMAIEQIRLYKSQISTVEESIKSMMLSLDSKIMTIPGISFNSAAVILSVIGDFTRFTHPKQIVAFAGIDPVVSQSGKFNALFTRMSKRGNSMLRYSLILSAFNISLHNKTFKDYYDKKRAEGKSHYQALGHVANKLVRVIYTIITRDISFNI
mgnify:CR=1 FL=1